MTVIVNRQKLNLQLKLLRIENVEKFAPKPKFFDLPLKKYRYVQHFLVFNREDGVRGYKQITNPYQFQKLIV
jgi:hypothetical protein